MSNHDNVFYVYEHWRPDKDICFYVGKGKGRRAYNFNRRGHHANVLKKLARLGTVAEVRLVASGLLESKAFALEIERIAFWRSLGVRLANQTDGGEGVSNPPPEVRAKIGRARLGKAVSAENRARLSAGQKRRFLDPEERRRCINRPEIRAVNPILQKGRKVSEETCAELSRTRTGKIDSLATRQRKSISGKRRHKERPFTEETKRAIGASKIGNQFAKGYKHPPETIASMSVTQKAIRAAERERGIIRRPRLGQHLNEEAKAVISAKLKDRPRSPEAIAKQLATNAEKRARGLSNPTAVKKTCKTCGSEFTVSRCRDGKAKFCSKTCLGHANGLRLNKSANLVKESRQ